MRNGRPAMIEFRLPSLGADMDEGTLLQWKVAPGDRVARGQVVAVVDTSKAAVDVEIWENGTVAELLVEPGARIPVGTVLATLNPAAAAAGAVPPPVPQVPPPRSQVPPAAAPTQLPGARELAAAARHPASPAARKRARELDVDPDTVAGTGPHAAVTVADVERAARDRAARAPAPVAAPAPAPVAAPAPMPAAPPPAPPAAVIAPPPAPAIAPAAAAERQKEMRKAIAAAMSRSKREIPHYYLSETIPLSAALDWLRRRNEALSIADRVLPAVLLLKAVAVALRRTPDLNGFFRDGRFEASAAVHAGVAISLRGGGLVAPAIHDVGGKPLEQLMRDLADLVKRARAGSLRSSEMSDPTITVTNLGDQGVESVHGVIYPPQVALVGFGRISERPWAQDGWLRAMPLVTATLAADHRVSDGHLGALFLAELRERLQRPEALIDEHTERAA
jgi:pyruvate dehydrogenase E2 component (dihydrolipoamide acetyltransferase)